MKAYTTTTTTTTTTTAMLIARILKGIFLYTELRSEIFMIFTFTEKMFYVAVGSMQNIT
jgi:hypothetical protein